MFKKKPKKNIGLSIAELNSRVRGFIFDSQMTDAAVLCEMMGCPAISEELEDHEINSSDDRVEKIEYLFPLLFSHSNLLAEAAIEYQKEHMEAGVKFPKEVWTFSRSFMSQVAFSTLVGSISQLVDMGLLTVPKKSVSK